MLKALTTAPIFIGGLVQRHINEMFPGSAVLVTNLDENGLDRDMLEQAFGKEGVRDICPDITDMCVIVFDKEAQAAEIKGALLQASKDLYLEEFKAEGEYMEEEHIYEACTIYKDGRPVCWDNI